MAEKNVLFIQLYNLLCEMREFYCDDEESAEVGLYQRGSALLAQCRPLVGSKPAVETPRIITREQRKARIRYKPMPNRAQLKALLDFARENGRGWKAKLDEVWMKASGGPLLQQVRNQFGPSWLVAVKLADLKNAWESADAVHPTPR